MRRLRNALDEWVDETRASSDRGKLVEDLQKAASAYHEAQRRLDQFDRNNVTWWSISVAMTKGAPHDR